MEDIVGIKVTDKILGEVAFITWGRVLHRTDPDQLINAVKKNLNKFGISQLVALHVCDTLQEVASFPYFYEAIFAFAQENPREGNDYMEWKNKKKKAIEDGEEIYFLGLTKEQKECRDNLGGTISHGFYYEIKK